LRHFLENPIAKIEIKMIGPFKGGKVDITSAITIDIPGCNP
jgi:hypothetical protein